MPNQKGRFTDKEKKFAQELAVLGDATKAAKMAGYSYPAQAAQHLRHNTAVQAEVVKIQIERINNHLLPLAVTAIERLLIDPKTPAGAQVQAAKLVFDRALGENATSDKAAHELTGDELSAQIDRLRLEVAKRTGQVIEGEVTPSPASAVGVFD